jgi:arsenite methyltransferase
MRWPNALEYPADLLDRTPGEAIESFAGVGYFVDLADLRPGERYRARYPR